MTCLQKTNLTIRGMFLEGFSVSPAVIPKLSVPPTKNPRIKTIRYADLKGSLTRKAGGHEHSSKTAKTANKRSARYHPITNSDKSMLRIEANIDQYSDKYEEDYSCNLER